VFVIFRGRDDPPSGGTRSLCMSKENLSLHMFPLRGDMDVGRREAMRRELMRLVTRESDDRQTCSPSSPGIVIFLYHFEYWVKPIPNFACYSLYQICYCIMLCLILSQYRRKMQIVGPSCCC
jgi:hypothetical protein